jgi:hypothetical protein
VPGRARPVGLQCHYALISASINSLAAKIPPALLAAAVRGGVRSLEYALTYARQNPDETPRTALLTQLACWLAESGKPDEALDLAKEVALDGSYHNRKLLYEIAPYVPERSIRETILLCERPLEIFNAPLARLLVRLAELGHAEEALAEARQMEPSPDRAYALSGTLPFLPADKRKEVLAEALSDASPIDAGKSGTEELLSILLPHLEPAERATLLREALAAARGLPDMTTSLRHASRPSVLLRLAKFVPEQERNSILSEVRAIAEKLPETSQFDLPSPRAKVLLELMPYVASNERQKLFNESLRLARNVGDAHKGLALAQLSAQMPEPFLQEALEAALAPRSWLQEQAFDELAPNLSNRLISEALVSFETIDDSRDQELLSWLLFETGDSEAGLAEIAKLRGSYKYSPLVAAMTAFSDRMTPAFLASALTLARKTLHGESLAEALCALASFLTPKLLPEALTAARCYKNDRAVARALICLATRLPEELAREAILATIDSNLILKHAEAIHSLVRRLSEGARLALLSEVKALIAQEKSRPATAERPPITKRRLPKRWRVVPDETRLVRLLLAAALLQSGDEGRSATLTMALRKTLAIEDPRQRLEALGQLSAVLAPSQLSEAVDRIRGHLLEADRSLTVLIDWFRSLGAPDELVSAYQHAETEDDLKEPSERIGEFTSTVERLTPEVEAAVGTLTRVGDWLKALAVLVPRFGASGRSDDAIALVRELKSSARLAIYFAETRFSLFGVANDLAEESLLELIPFLREAHLGQAIELTNALIRNDRLQVKLRVREAELGLHARALDHTCRMWHERDRAEALVGIIPHLPEQMLWERRKLSIGKHRKRVDRQKEQAGSTVTASEIERPVLELAAFAWAESESPHADDERSVMILSLVPYLILLPEEALYKLWCELLPLLAARSRLALTQDLRSLIRLIRVFGGTSALLQVKEALIAVNRCFP